MNQTNIFDVVVIATMSAGKSTVINALIGHELLHSANEATTATITRIHDKDSLTSFEGMTYDFDGNVIDMEETVDGELLRKWNADPSIKTIDLAGNIKAIHNDHAEIVIYDTPGPNNSQDGSHAMLTMEVIDDGQFGLILYVLNATQLGINDDKELLEKIRKSLDQDMHKEIIFLLNKADCLDQDKGESIDKLVANAQNYLNNLGFANPTIICTTAQQALLAQKVLNGEALTRSQRNELKQALSFLDDTSILLGSKMESEIKAEVLELAIKLDRQEAAKKIELHETLTVDDSQMQRLICRSGFAYVYAQLQNRLKESVVAEHTQRQMEQERDLKSDTMELIETSNINDVLIEIPNDFLDRAGLLYGQAYRLYQMLEGWVDVESSDSKDSDSQKFIWSIWDLGSVLDYYESLNVLVVGRGHWFENRDKQYVMEAVTGHPVGSSRHNYSYSTISHAIGVELPTDLDEKESFQVEFKGFDTHGISDRLWLSCYMDEEINILDLSMRLLRTTLGEDNFDEDDYRQAIQPRDIAHLEIEHADLVLASFPQPWLDNLKYESDIEQIDPYLKGLASWYEENQCRPDNLAFVITQAREYLDDEAPKEQWKKINKYIRQLKEFLERYNLAECPVFAVGMNIAFEEIDDGEYNVLMDHLRGVPALRKFINDRFDEIFISPADFESALVTAKDALESINMYAPTEIRDSKFEREMYHTHQLVEQLSR